MSLFTKIVKLNFSMCRFSAHVHNVIGSGNFDNEGGKMEGVADRQDTDLGYT